MDSMVVMSWRLALQAFMVIVWIVVEIMFVFLFFSLPTADLMESSSKDQVREQGPAPLHHAINSPAPDEKSSLLPDSKHATDSLHNDSVGFRAVWTQKVWHLIREELVVLLAVAFVTMFNQTGLEVGNRVCVEVMPLVMCLLCIQAMCVPMTQDLLHWSERDVSLFYSGAGLEVCCLCASSVISLLCDLLEDHSGICGGVHFVQIY